MVVLWKRGKARVDGGVGGYSGVMMEGEGVGWSRRNWCVHKADKRQV